MPPRKAKGKAGGKPIKPPKRPAPQSSSSDEDDGEMTLIKGMIQRLEALERAKALPSDMGAGPSGKGGRTRTRGAARTQLIDSLSVRLKAMEERLSGPSDVPVVVLDEAAVPGALQQEESSSAVEMSAVAQPVGQVSGTGAGGYAGPGGHAGSPVEAWHVAARQAIDASLAPSTRVSYRAKVGAFSTFRRQEGLVEAWPVPVEHVMQFLVSLFRAGKAVSTMGGYVSALAFEAQVQGVQDTTGDPRVKRMLEGWARQQPRGPDKRRPLTLDVVVALIRHLPVCCSSPWEATLMKAASLVYFFGAFRPSEVLPWGRHSPVGRCLQFGDLSFEGRGVTLLLRSSKTDQEGKGQVIRLHAASDPGMCPVMALRQYVAGGPKASGCLFVHERGDPLTQYQLWAVLRKAMACAGVSDLGFSLHSFRIGAATTASGLGLEARDVQRIGRWKSDAFLRYVR
ncbi:uncharacterized protein LOC128325774 isoform X1 [Hemicordylus capensis]|uniref:uncharacterized protein LOC128325774 isoform X1 n=1 Tax=Hemicordylus capensis TaxID=884348 RepID=UPI0023045B17|nr:uncharacterized protein LOC128325774 isoform X1 [Hemicordylus capensis]